MELFYKDSYNEIHDFTSKGNPMKPIISKTTQKNWQRLSPNYDTKLKTRANKTLSNKQIIPFEYYENHKNYNFSTNLVSLRKLTSLSTESILYHLAYKLLSLAELQNARHVEPILTSFRQKHNISEVNLSFPIPYDERDLLGIAYQSLLCEGEKNQIGSYYTPYSVVRTMLPPQISTEQILLDPCCGSGSFLLAANCENPEMLYGFDKDDIAVFLAQINLILKYKEQVFQPQIYCLDFLQDPLPPEDFKADYIISNPPWGALPMKKEDCTKSNFFFKESFSQFLAEAMKYLKESGMLIYLLPESFLSVKSHKAIRKYILDNFKMNSIRHFDRLFNGVSTKYISLSLSFGHTEDMVLFSNSENQWDVPLESFYLTDDYKFNGITGKDYAILCKIFSQKKSDLKGSRWGLGIVTGDNKTKLLTQASHDSEPIYTGKEITKYRLLPAKHYINYHRAELQQVAPEQIYRSKPKLVYRFISDHLVFAYDENAHLFLNSANILIPDPNKIEIKTALGLLNSTLYQYLYQNLYGGVKVLRNSIENLPLPEISELNNSLLLSLVNEYLATPNGSILKKIDRLVYQLFALDEAEIAWIESHVKSF